MFIDNLCGVALGYLSYFLNRVRQGAGLFFVSERKFIVKGLGNLSSLSVLFCFSPISMRYKLKYVETTFYY